jgi:hypothetical protein
MPGAALAVKQRAYAHFARSHEWAREPRPLPGLLAVTPDPGQEQRIQRLAWICAEAESMIRATTVGRLEQQEPLAPIWLTLLPNQPHTLQQPLLDTPRSPGTVREGFPANQQYGKASLDDWHQHEPRYKPCQ